MTLPFISSFRSEEPKTAPEVRVKTLEPDTQNRTQSGVNIVLMASEYGQGQLEEIDAEIEKLEARLRYLQDERTVVKQLYDIASAHQSSKVRLI